MPSPVPTLLCPPEPLAYFKPSPGPPAAGGGQEGGGGPGAAATVLDEVAVLELEDGCGEDEDTWYMRLGPALLPGPAVPPGRASRCGLISLSPKIQLISLLRLKSAFFPFIFYPPPSIPAPNSVALLRGPGRRALRGEQSSFPTPRNIVQISA